MKKLILTLALIFYPLLAFADAPTTIIAVSDDTTTVYTTQIGFVGADVSKSGSKAIVTIPPGNAPTDATYITQTPNGTLTAEQALSGLTTGLMKVTNGTGVITTAVSGTDVKTINSTSLLGSGNITLVATESDPVVKALIGIISSDGVTISSTPDNHNSWDTAYTHSQNDNDTSATNELPTAGNGIDVAGTIVSIDTSEINSTTWGDNTLASFAHTYDITGTDVTVTFSNNKITFSGDLQVTGDLYVTDVFVTNVDGDNYVLGKLGIGKTNPSYPLDVVGAIVSNAVTTDNVTVVTTGVKLTGSNGSLIFTGLGDGQDENLKLDLNTSADTATISSTTGVTSIDAGNIIWKGKHSASDYTAGASATTGGLTFKDGLYTSGSSSGLSDGDKGDITVSGSGTIWNIDPDVVTKVEIVDNFIDSLDASTLADADEFIFYDDTAGTSKKITWANLKTSIHSADSHSKSFTITNPTSSADAICLWRADKNLIISGVHLYCEGAGIVGHLTIENGGVDGATDITGIVNTMVTDDTSLSNPNVTAGQRIGWRTTSVTSGATRANVTFDF